MRHLGAAAFLLVALARSSSWAGVVPDFRVVVLDERSPHLGIVRQVREVFAEELQVIAEGGGSFVHFGVAREEGGADGGKSSSAQGVLRLLVEEALAGNIDLPPWGITSQTVNLDDPYAKDPLVSAVAAELDLEAGVYSLGVPGTVLAVGRIVPPAWGVDNFVSSTDAVPLEVREGSCDMPDHYLYPTFTNARGKNLRKVRAYTMTDTATCQLIVPTKREARKAKLFAGRNLESRKPGTIFTGVEEQKEPAVPGTGQVRSVFEGCGPHLIACGHGNTNRFARLKARVYNAFGNVSTNVTGQTYWQWNGSSARCSNVGPYMYDLVTLEGPGDLDLKWEPRSCDINRGEFCRSECALDWIASTIAPNSTFNFWQVAIGDVPFDVDLRVVEAAASRVDGSYAAFC